MASSSSSMAATPASPATSHLSSTLGGAAPSGSAVIAAQFREIHKNTWLKRLTAEGKKITVGPKKSDRSWVVFCVHDDTEALLEGYAEPRQAAGHSPEWIVSMQDTLHISHALIPNSHEFEFVVTLSNEVVRFHAMSWEIMQEWVETLRLKLREMKILSPRENLYTKLPEIRAPLLPTRDPTSPLPAPPPVPAALVPGVERVVPPSLQQETAVTAAEINADTTTRCTTAAATLTTTSHSNASQYTLRTTSSSSSSSNNSNISIAATAANQVSSTATVTTVAPTPMLSAMSNTLTQNLLNMLSDPISAYSEQLNGVAAADEDANSVDYFEEDNLFTEQDLSDDDFQQELLSRLLRKSCREHSETVALTDNSVRVDVGASNRTSADQIKNWENLMHAERPSQSRPQTSRSLSAGAADETRRSSSRKQTSKLNSQHHETLTTSSSNNITELEISADSTIPVTTTATTSTPTTRSSSTPTVPTATEADKTNITIIQVSTTTDVDSVGANEPPAEPTSKPKLPTKHITAEIFKFPETYIPIAAATTAKAKQHEYKSNVQIIPSNIATNSSTIQVLGHQHVGGSTPANQYSSPVKKHPPAAMNAKVTAAGAAAASHHKITTVHVAGDATTTTTTVTTSASQTSSGISIYGTCFTAAPSTSTVTQAQSIAAGTPKLPKKIILSANTSGVTNITVNNAFGAHTPDLRARSNDEIAGNIGCDGAVKHNAGTVHYEKVFLSSSVPITPAATAIVSAAPTMASMSPKTQSAQWNSPKRQAGALIPITSQTAAAEAAHTSSNSPSSPTPAAEMRRQKLSVTTAATQTPTTVASASKGRTKSTQSSASTSNRANIVGGSPALERRRIASPGSQCVPTTSQPPLPLRPPFLTRGLTEAVITTRPSRRDFHFLKQTVGKSKAPHAVASANTNKSLATTSTNNNDDVGNAAMPVTVSRTNSELQEQRKRSSSTSDARNNARGTNNNEFPGGRGAGTGGPGGGGGYAALRIQQPPQPFRSVENGTGGMPPAPSNATGPTGNSPAAKRMTLREQQVMQLRREIMHPGGVRLQLRRKDCVGSIAWVDAFGAVWVAGWKQKEHPVLYNALHIGDQLLSIAGISINAAAEANKIIRNTNTLFVEVLVRRIPFGRGYAIRREREGQCLGLIRDGNTSTIVDVVPNSLAARHGLPPKAQSCDGVTLTFWVLTEINGRPLNLFFKDNEIRDRLNSVGRDISILVQPSDLIVKLKKQLKSLRGYKDYLVQ